MITNIQKTELLEFARECREVHIPVVRESTAKLLCEYIQKLQPKKILEIGTAVGYSGTLMLLSSQNSKLTTIDSNVNMSNRACETFSKYGVSERVKIVTQDALEYLKNCNEVFDFVFLDGPKGQYIKYYPYLEKVTKSSSIIFCDDVLYYGMILDESKVIHKKITIVRNLKEFLNLAQTDPIYNSKLLEIDDGVLILERK